MEIVKIDLADKLKKAFDNLKALKDHAKWLEEQGRREAEKHPELKPFITEHNEAQWESLRTLEEHLKAQQREWEATERLREARQKLLH